MLAGPFLAVRLGAFELVLDGSLQLRRRRLDGGVQIIRHVLRGDRGSPRKLRLQHAAFVHALFVPVVIVKMRFDACHTAGPVAQSMRHLFPNMTFQRFAALHIVMVNLDLHTFDSSNGLSSPYTTTIVRLSPCPFDDNPVQRYSLPPMSILLTAQNLSKTYGTRRLFEGVAISISQGERLGLIGPNGSGKSTLLKTLAGIEQPDTGTITTRRGLRIGYVPQRDSFPEGATAMEVVLAAVCDRMHDEHERHDQAEEILTKLGFDDHNIHHDKLSGGWRKRLAIARALAAEPDVLLMDEPTNHLDLEGIIWLEKLLDEAEFASVVVTHDRYFLEEAASRVVELSRAYPQGTFSVEGSYSDFLVKRAEFLEAQSQQQASLANKVREDLRWLGRGAKARRTKSKSRIGASYERMDELADLKSRNAPARAAGIDFTASGRQTRNLLVAKDLSKSLGGKPLFQHLDLILSPGMRLGLLGPNGSGKTSLIKTLLGEIPPDTGTLKQADKLRVVTFTQRREEIDPRVSLREAICPGADFVIYRDRQIHVNTWASMFLFRTDQYNTSVGDLSGGEQARILIARLMLRPADLLILDEPTNDLDIPSLEVLEQSLSEFPGAVLLVTHDRFMLDRLSTDVLGLDGNGNAKLYADYPQWQAAQDAAEREAASPKSAAANAPTGGSTATAAKVKLSYKEQRELDSMESNIATAEAEAKRLEAQFGDPAVIADHKKMQQCCEALDAAHAKVARFYARWEELEAKIKG